MDRRGRWRAWRFGPDTPARHARQASEAAAAGQVLFCSVQTFAAPRYLAGMTRWTKVREQYSGERALPHGAPLFFDIDADGDLDTALLWARELVGFFADQLDLPAPAVRVWFSGAKGAHVLVDATALEILPSATLTADMKLVALGLINHLTSQGAPKITIDASVYSLPRMLRMPDQFHPRSGLYKVELSHRELFQCSIDEIVALAGQPRGALWLAEELPARPHPSAAAWWSSALARAQLPREFRIKTAQVAGLRVRPDGYVVDELTSAKMPSCIKAIFDANVPAGSRNRCELQIACWAKSAKIPRDRALAMLSAWTDRNRPELSADNARRKAESIIRSVYGNARYGFSCVAARSAARAAGTEPACNDCPVVRQRSRRQVFSLRLRHDDQWSPVPPISLEHARELIAAAINERVALASPLGRSGFRRSGWCLPALGGSGDGTSGHREDPCGDPVPRSPRNASCVCDAHA